MTICEDEATQMKTMRESRQSLATAVLKRHSKQVVLKYRQHIGPPRALPDFMIIGAMRCGTTSLYNYLIEHPDIHPAVRKEIRFFSHHYGNGLDWYRAHFPTCQERSEYQVQGRPYMTGEATPFYLFHPHAHQRAFDIVPDVKLIVLLRNPVHRAYSHYNHSVWKGKENLSFAEAIAEEGQRLHSRPSPALSDADYESEAYKRFSYLSRGIYVDQLKRWMTRFPHEQMLVLKSEDFYADPVSTLREVTDFLGLSPWKPRISRTYNSLKYPPMDDTTERFLYDVFELHNQRLYEYLGVDFGWR